MTIAVLESIYQASNRTRVPNRPLRAILAGCGVVGGGVLDRLGRALPGQVEIQTLLTATPRKAGLHGIPVVTNPRALEDVEADLLIDTLPDNAVAETLIERGIERGLHIVSANKAVLARRPDLFRKARERGLTLACSAAVGGGAPILETIAALKDEDRTLVRVRGVLNGTSNFVLDRLGRGDDLRSAVLEAQAAGFAEADPSADLDGYDAANKLVLIAREAWGVELDPRTIDTQSIDELPIDALETARRDGRVLRQVGSLTRSALGVKARVRLEALRAHDPLAKTRDEGNCVLLTLETGRTVRVSGKGAGRIPTANSVIGDIARLCEHAFRAPCPAR